MLRSSPVATPLRGTLRCPGDKSLSHRAVILGTLARGETRVGGWLEAGDTMATLGACRKLGAEVHFGDDGLRIRGTGGRLRVPGETLDLGNSGTGARLLLGVLAGQSFAVTLTGDRSLRSRPMRRVTEPLARMGARFETAPGGCLPITVRGGELRGAHHRLPVASAQVKSALLLAGIQASGVTGVFEPLRSRDHTERMLPMFGCSVPAGRVLRVQRCELQGCNLSLPGDFSSAVFPLAAALLVPGSRVEVVGVGINPTRSGWLEAVRLMGGRVAVAETSAGHEPAARLEAISGPLTAIALPEAEVVRGIDELPLLMALAACARDVTRIRGAAELRVKESDRLAAMCEALRRLGIDCQERADGADIRGGHVRGGAVDARGDHRVAMSLAVLGTIARSPIEIGGADAIATSYPAFVGDLSRLGARLEWRR